MINSRSLDELHPSARIRVDAFLQVCHEEGIDILVTSTYRDHESQNALYNQGRGTLGKIVTNARGGFSWHNYRCAIDIVPLRNGKPVWGTKGEDGKLWEKIGVLGEQAGLEWAGRWQRFRELAHFQYTAGLTLADLRAGIKIP
jgi:peptidoglycan L-alanyl-D-glutamate endopeptidase CwlK